MKHLTDEKDIFAFLLENIPSTQQTTFPAETGLARTKYFLDQLGAPQNKYPSIHVAGTSGKGSTSFYASHILNSIGYKVGLIQSPHVLNIKERFQINNQLIPTDKYVLYFNEILGAFFVTSKESGLGTPTYFEILTVLAFHIFHREAVDVAVIETGVGGLFDASNTISRKDKICTITHIGLDHTRILGETYKEIASQKAGIIHKGNTVVMIEQESAEAAGVVAKIANAKDANLLAISEGKNFQKSGEGVSFNFDFDDIHIKNISLATIADYQIANCALALASAYTCFKNVLTIIPQTSPDKVSFDSAKISARLKKVHFIGRMDVFKLKNRTIILDGAHNEQKMNAFITSLTRVYPQTKFHFIVAFKKEKNYEDMLKVCEPYLASLTATRLWIAADSTKRYSIDPEEIVAHVKEQHPKLGPNNIAAFDQPNDALSHVLLITKENDIIVVTGSLFLVGKVYSLVAEHTE